MESQSSKLRKRIEEKSHKGFCGFPIGTVAFYGHDDQHATKVVVGIILKEGGQVEHIKKWLSSENDVREDAAILKEMLSFLDEHKVLSVAITPGIYGCPHEEGIDYPEGGYCPYCPFWNDVDRDTIFQDPSLN